VAEVFGSCPWLEGIPEVCADIRERGERSVVITMSPDFFARHLLGLGFDEVKASRWPALPFREPLDPGGILTPGDKVRIVRVAGYGLIHARRSVSASSRRIAQHTGYPAHRVAPGRTFRASLILAPARS
jgi:phosphoserine phosphatase